MKIADYNLAKTPVKMRDQYILYARKSSEAEDRQVASIENQLEVLIKLAGENGLNILRTISEAKSGKDLNRPGFLEMVKMIDSRDDIKGILCWKPNRLFRNPQDEGVIRQRLSDARILEVVTPTKTYTEADSDFILAIEGSQAQKFIRDLRADTRRGIDRKLENGNAPILAPVGYRNDLEKRQGERTISPHPLFFQLVRKIFELALTGQFTTHELYKKAVQLGIKTAHGKNISRNQMYSLLTNPFYTGRFLYAGVMYQGAHKPMLTDGEFDAVQGILKSRSKPRKQIHSFPLRGFVKCGVCNRTYTAETHTKKSGLVFDYYKCSQKGKGCYQPMISAKDLEAQVGEFLNRITIKKVYSDWCIKWLREAEAQDRAVRLKQHEALKADYTNSVKKLDNLTDKWLSVENEDKSLISNDEYKRLKQKYLIEKQIIYRQMKSSDKELSEWTDTMVGIFNFAQGVTEKWRTGTLEDKRYIMAVVGANLTLKDKKLTINPRTPFQYIEKAVSNQLSEASSRLSNFQYLVLGGWVHKYRTAVQATEFNYIIPSSQL